MPRRKKAGVSKPGKGKITASKVLGIDSSALFRKVAEDVLHRKRTMFDSLTSHEKRIVVDWLSSAIVEGDAKTALHDVLWEIDFVRQPASIEQFIEDDYYLGRSASQLHPNLKRDLSAVFTPGSPIFEWVLTGSIGWGKTTATCVGMAYKLHWISCLRDPSAYYGLLSDSLMVFGVYSVTKKQVSDSGYFKLRGFIDSSPYFRQQFPRSTKIDSQMDFTPTGQQIKVIPGSQELHAIGLDLFAFCMDEVNFMRVKDNKESGKQTGQAYDLYNATYTRLQSRFVRPGGSLPGIMFLLSSRNAETSFLEEHIRKVRSGPSPESTYISDYALWETKSKRFTWPGFRVEVGDRVAKSRIMKDEGDETRRGAKVVEVPWEFHKPFLEDVDQALRDIAGVATFNLSPLIRDRESVLDAVSDVMPNPFTRDEVTCDITDDVMIDEFFRIKDVAKVVMGKWVPKLNPQAPRFIHVDIGLTGDALGFAMGHVAGKVKVERINTDGTTSAMTSPFVVIDLMIRVSAPVGGEVDLGKVRAFINYLRKLYVLTKITFDGFQSADSIQILRKEQMDAGKQSVDRTDEAYMSLRSAMFDRRMAMPDYQPFRDEVLDLVRERRSTANAAVPSWKVDHPTRASKGGKGSKDVTDAVAGVVWLCMNDERALQSVVADLEVEAPKAEKAKGHKRTRSKPTSRKRAPKEVAPPEVETKVGHDGVPWDDLAANV